MTISLPPTRGRGRFIVAMTAVAAVLALARSGAAVSVAAAGAPRPWEPSQVTTEGGSHSLLVKFASSPDGAVHVAAAGDVVLGKTKTRVDVVRIAGDESLDAKLAQYRARADVIYAEPNYIASATVLEAPDDPSYNSQWALRKTQAIGGWSLFPGSYGIGSGATIGILDTGVDLAHPDLAPQLDTANAANCVDADKSGTSDESGAWDESGTCVAGSALDDAGHGTHTTGIAAAATNNGFGVAGTAFSSHVIPVKVLGGFGGSYAAVTNGISWAAQHGARVISLSLGGYFYSKTLCDAVTTATESYHALVVAAVGNERSPDPLYPAGCPGAIGVAATNASDRAASWSNFGSSVFVSAPGVSIYSTYPPSSFATLSGTSMATPAVAGLAALLFGQDPSRTPGDVKAILARSADKVGGVRYAPDPSAFCAGCTRHPRYGYGRINVRRALGGPDLTLNAFPASRTVKRGTAASYALTVAGSGGFAAGVTSTTSGLPVGSRTSFSPSLMTQASTLRIRVPKRARPGTYPFAVSARGDGLTRSVNLLLRVTR